MAGALLLVWSGLLLTKAHSRSREQDIDAYIYVLHNGRGSCWGSAAGEQSARHAAGGRGAVGLSVYVGVPELVR